MVILTTFCNYHLKCIKYLSSLNKNTQVDYMAITQCWIILCKRNPHQYDVPLNVMVTTPNHFEQVDIFENPYMFD
jgi:hypothetical protein